jgi:DNA-binding NarL/FixJ family response regulator
MELAPHTASPISVLLVGKYQLARAGLRVLIEKEPGIDVVCEAETLADAAAAARLERPDIVLFDLLAGGEAELENLPTLLGALKQARALVLSSVLDPAVDRRAVKMGAMGLVSKHAAPNLLIKAIRKVHVGEAWLDRCTMANVLTEMSRPEKEQERNSSPPPIAALTKRERDIIRLVSRGYKNRQVASHLAISDVTVRHHLTSVFSKLALTDRFELIIYAYKNGLADQSENTATEGINWGASTDRAEEKSKKLAMFPGPPIAARR